MPAGLCVPNPGRGSVLGCRSPPRVRDGERWWQWPEEGPVTDGARDLRKGGLRRGRSRADAAGKLRGPGVRSRNSACGGLLLKPPGLPLRPGCPICPHTGHRAGLGKGPRRVQTVRARGRRDRGGGTQEAKTRAAPVAPACGLPRSGVCEGRRGSSRRVSGVALCPLRWPPLQMGWRQQQSQRSE